MERWKYRILLAIIALAIIIYYPFFTIKYFETQKALIIVWRYFSFPIFVILSILCPLLYFKKVKPLDKAVLSKRKEKARDIVSIGLMIIVATFVCFGCAFSLIIATNKWFDKSNSVLVKTRVIRYHPDITKHGKLNHFIDFVNPETKDTIVNFNVYRSYKAGEIFEKELHSGAWGILYATNKIY